MSRLRNSSRDEFLERSVTKTTADSVLTPRAVEPLLVAACAYSICSRPPCGENTCVLTSYTLNWENISKNIRQLLLCFFFLLLSLLAD